MQLKLISQRKIAGAFENGYREARIPALAALEDGSVLMAYEARAGKNGDWGDIDIIVKRLAPDGSLAEVLRLGESHLPADGGMRTWGNPTFIDAGSGRVLLLFNRNYERAYCVASADGGCSWSDQTEITAALRGFDYDWNVCAIGPGHGARLTDGSLACGIWLAHGEYYDTGLRRRHYPSVSGALVSPDGVRWQSGLLFDRLPNQSETSCAALPDGRLLFSIRNEDASPQRAFACSADGGKTLDGVFYRALTDPCCFGGLCSFQGGALQANCQSPDKRENLALSFTPDGKSWQTLYRFSGPAGYADVYAQGGNVYVLAEIADAQRGLIGEIVLYTLKTDN